MDRMKNRLVGFAAALLLAAAAYAETPQDILAKSDAIRNSGQPFHLVNTLTEYIRGQANNRMVLSVYSKENRATREYATLVRYIDPPRDRGKMVLMNGSNMWFYDSASKASVRISPQQRLMGQASDGDVVTVNFSRDYKVTAAADETIKDADRKDRQCWRLELAAAGDAAVYSRIEYWIEKGTYRSIKGRFYSDSGRLLKTAFYHKYTEMLGGVRPAETILIDAVDQNLVTTMENGTANFTDVPDAWFQRDFLPHLKAE
jgi:hypothetical protein